MNDTSAAPLSLLSILRQWPVASNIAEHLPAGSLINLARSSTSLRSALHGFAMSTTLEHYVTSSLGASTRPGDSTQEVGSRRALHIGAHRTPYWESLKRVAPFLCSSKTHTKGDKTRSCLYCSMPICESCIVKHSFGKNENTFKNRCRFMCQFCWDMGNGQKERRYRGRSGAADNNSHKSAAEARNYCTCTSRDGWVCNDCKEKQNMDARMSGTKLCIGLNCDTILEEDKDRRRICLWCDKPVPRSRASIEARIALNQRIIDARSREMTWQVADLEGYKSNRRQQMRMSRREMRGDEAAKDDPDADVPHFIRNLDLFNYQRLCGEQPTGQEIYDSKHGRWRYRSSFLMRFRVGCLKHKDADFLRSVTSFGPSDAPTPKTNNDLSKYLAQRAVLAGIDGTGEAMLNAGMDPSLDKTAVPCRTEEQLPDAEAGSHHLDESVESQREQEIDDECSMLEDDEVIEAFGEIEVQVPSRESGSLLRTTEFQSGERPPLYDADTLMLEAGDAMEID